jgi:hypothetical protein
VTGLHRKKRLPGRRRRAMMCEIRGTGTPSWRKRNPITVPIKPVIMMPFGMARTMKSAGGVGFLGTILPNIRGPQLSAEMDLSQQGFFFAASSV